MSNVPVAGWSRYAAYERAAIACALTASTGHVAGTSAGTTPRRYVSIGSSLTTLTLAVASVLPIRRRTPRKWSYADGFDQSCRTEPLPGRTRRLADEALAYRVEPSAAVTVIFHVVAVPDVVGVNLSRASAGNVALMPSMVHGPPR